MTIKSLGQNQTTLRTIDDLFNEFQVLDQLILKE